LNEAPGYYDDQRQNDGRGLGKSQHDVVLLSAPLLAEFARRIRRLIDNVQDPFARICRASQQFRLHRFLSHPLHGSAPSLGILQQDSVIAADVYGGRHSFTLDPSFQFALRAI
jgi:hypothetical protein